MTVSNTDTKNTLINPDDAPELTDEWFDNATLKMGETLIRRGGRPRGSTKEQVTLRLDKVVLDHFRSLGPGWQTQLNDALRAVVNRPLS